MKTQQIKKGKAGNKFGAFAELILTAAEAPICGFEETWVWS